MQPVLRTTSPRALSALVPALVLALLLALLLVLAVLTPAPAFAHAALSASSPADGARLEAAPRQVTFTFSEDVAAPAYVAVTGPDGASLTQGEPVVDGPVVTQRLEAGAGEGAHTMAYRVASADGHPITGELGFSVVAPGSPAEQPAAGARVASEASGGQADAGQVEAGQVQVGSVVLGAGAVLLGGSVVLVGLARRRREA